MTYELWDLTSRNLIDWFEDRTEAHAAVRAYVDAGEEDFVMLVVDAAEGQLAGSYSGRDLIAWAESGPSDTRRSA